MSNYKSVAIDVMGKKFVKQFCFRMSSKCRTFIRVSCFLIGWFSQSLRIQRKTFVCFCLRSKKHPTKTITEKGRIKRIELFPNFLAHFKLVGKKKIEIVASRKLRTTVMQSKLILLAAALHCRNYRRNRRVFFTFSQIKISV